MKKLTLAFCFCLSLAACNSEQSSTSELQASSSSSDTQALTFTGQHTRLIGRFDFTESDKARFTWPGSAMEFVFEGTRADVRIASTDRARFEIDVNGNKQDLWVEAGEKNYTLANNLNPGVHQLRLTRLTESFAIVTTFTSDPIVDGQLLPPPTAPERRLLVIGDSITAGYGVEGESHSCGYAHDTSNQQLTYAAIAARALNADLHSIAWSGIGAWRSYGEETPANPTILVRYQRTLADDASSQWDSSRYQPHALLINIGTNDYWQGSVSDDYRLGMQALIRKVQADYPQVPVYLIASAMLGGDARAAQVAVLSSLAGDGVTLLDLGKIESADGLGCDYHPNLITQTRMGESLQARLLADLGW